MGALARIGSEWAYLSGALRALSRVTDIARHPRRTFPDVAETLAERFGDKVALIGERETLTYRRWNRRANQYARWAKANGIGKGDCVALVMRNRPDFHSFWLGVARAGGVTALVNTNLSGSALAHCIDIVAPRLVVADAACRDAVAAVGPGLKGAPKLWARDGGAAGLADLDAALAAFSEEPVAARERPALTTDDRCLFIYTSGTTGLPKAANINHYRVQAIMQGFAAAMRLKSDDRIYCCLPMYHTSGGLIASGAALVAGASAVIRERFSARDFWEDVSRSGCTVFEYIGELCRYLLNCPPHPKERAHNLRLACGNGLRGDIWAAFQERFRMPRILEWYAATEGNAVFFNFDGKPGSIGRIPKWAERRFVTEVVRFDMDTHQPVRGKDGFLVKCAPGEVGEVISQILNDPKRPSQRFEGYADAAATETKIVRNAFAKEDSWFRSGDLMKKDALGYFYFVDRVGDTFRWKGENVATSEVEARLSVYPGVTETTVYGVEVPGADGRAGMAAIAGEGVDLHGLADHLARELPAYARPMFIRLLGHIPATATFKQRKTELVREGYDPSTVSDPLYVLDPAGRRYLPLDAARHATIQAGSLRR